MFTIKSFIFKGKSEKEMKDGIKYFIQIYAQEFINETVINIGIIKLTIEVRRKMFQRKCKY